VDVPNSRELETQLLIVTELGYLNRNVKKVAADALGVFFEIY